MNAVAAHNPVKVGEYHTHDQLAGMLTAMSAASTMFYSRAVTIQNHPFIEFTGLMNEYINCCRAALEQGLDFTQCNTHSGFPLPIPEHALRYIHEKLECIFEGHDDVTMQFHDRNVMLRLDRLGRVLAKADAVIVGEGESYAEAMLKFLEDAWSETPVAE